MTPAKEPLAANSFSGAAELAYVKYDATVGGEDVFSGSTLAQNYSLSYKASNLYRRDQQQYYDLRFGYIWSDFTTKIDAPGQDAKISQSYSHFLYSGEVGYNPPTMPIKFSAFRFLDSPTSYNLGNDSESLIGSGLLYSITDAGSNTTSGVTFSYDPDKARNLTLRGLPRLYLEYTETVSKNTAYFSSMDAKTKNLAVAGLNMEKNWVNFRSTIYENYLVPSDSYRKQQLQIGHVDYRGQRLWSALTNWIEVSTDGRLTTYDTPSYLGSTEEYDLNFMAIAQRRTWEASTFMNYNRILQNESFIENASIPVYVKGVYGTDSTWFVGLTAVKGAEIFFSKAPSNSSYSNTVTFGGSTFNRSAFTLAPSVTLQTSRYFGQSDGYSLLANLETASTSRFSNKAGLAARFYSRAQDDGLGTVQSKSWSSGLEFRGYYTPDNNFACKLTDILDFGNGTGYINSQVYATGANATKTPDYLRNFFAASAAWTPTALFSTTLSGSHDITMSSAAPTTDTLSLSYNLHYSNDKNTLRVETRYSRASGASGFTGTDWRSSLEYQYRPDRYKDGLLRMTQQRNQLNNNNNTADLYTVLQRFNYNIFSRDGVLRNLATLSEEYGYSGAGAVGQSGGLYSTQYVSLSARYSPTTRLSLYSSATYRKENPGSSALFYGAGINADFKLLTSSLDYAYAKRDSDNRIEKRLTTSLRRTF